MTSTAHLPMRVCSMARAPSDTPAGARIGGMERHAVGGQAEVRFLVELGHQRGDERGSVRFADGDEGKIGGRFGRLGDAAGAGWKLKHAPRGDRPGGLSTQRLRRSGTSRRRRR